MSHKYCPTAIACLGSILKDRPLFFEGGGGRVGAGQFPKNILHRKKTAGKIQVRKAMGERVL